jgi:hypothetical protein
VDPTVFLQFVAQMEPDPYNSHVAFWDEYLATVMDFEGPLAVLEVCKALEVTGDMSLQLLAARHAIQAAPWTISHGEALLKAVAVFRKAHGIPHNDQQGGGSSGTMLRLAADPSTPARLKIPIPQWVSFLSAYATTTSCASPAEGFSILRAIPAQVLLADPCGGGGGGGGCSSSSLSGVRWRLLNDMAAMLMTMDVAEFLAGFGSLLADLTAEAPVETSATVSQQGVTVAHYFALEVYRGIPTVELRAERAARLRGAVISACIEYGCLHPLLWSHPPPARTGN